MQDVRKRINIQNRKNTKEKEIATTMAKPMKTLELHYPMIQFLRTSGSHGQTKLYAHKQSSTRHFVMSSLSPLGPDYMSRAGPVSRAASVWAGPVVM